MEWNINIGDEEILAMRERGGRRGLRNFEIVFDILSKCIVYIDLVWIEKYQSDWGNSDTPPPVVNHILPIKPAPVLW